MDSDLPSEKGLGFVMSMQGVDSRARYLASGLEAVNARSGQVCRGEINSVLLMAPSVRHQRLMTSQTSHSQSSIFSEELKAKRAFTHAAATTPFPCRFQLQAYNRLAFPCEV